MLTRWLALQCRSGNGASHWRREGNSYIIPPEAPTPLFCSDHHIIQFHKLPFPPSKRHPPSKMGSVANVSADQWLAAASHRRSVYPLKGTSSVSDARVKEIIEKVLSFAPSSYNTQPVRITLITGPKHKQFWDTIIAAAEPVLKGISEDVWNAMSPKFQLFKSAYGSVRFFFFFVWREYFDKAC